MIELDCGTVCAGSLKVGVSELKKSGKLSVFVTVVSLIAAAVSLAVAVVLYLEKKKKDEEDLEHYLDCSIQ
jgi:mannitol-specific phosphotransferase system IIBC component